MKIKLISALKESTEMTTSKMIFGGLTEGPLSRRPEDHSNSTDKDNIWLNKL